LFKKKLNQSFFGINFLKNDYSHKLILIITKMIFPEIKMFKPDSFEDYRGELFTVYKSVGFDNINFNHDKVSISRKDVLRGMHGDY